MGLEKKKKVKISIKFNLYGSGVEVPRGVAGSDHYLPPFKSSSGSNQYPLLECEPLCLTCKQVIYDFRC